MGKIIAYCQMSFCLLVMLHGLVHGVPITSCDQLPHPEACHNLVHFNPLSAGEKPTLGFQDMNMQGAMQRAQRTHLNALAKDLRKLPPKARAAWEDCMELSEETLNDLRRCTAHASERDQQTWLSAAVARQQTCLNGFSDFELPMQVNLMNMSYVLSNLLAINKASMPVPSRAGGNRKLLSFPEWVSAGDRRLLQSTKVDANVVVAKDGSGDYKTIKEAVDVAKTKGKGKRFVIHVKAGVYKENVDVSKSVKNLMIVGDGIDATVVTGSRNVKDGYTTFRSATLAANGQGFIARDITFENTAGPEKHQAVALRSSADLSIFYRCSFKGYQDTLYVHSNRQFYRDCDIYGTVDFIFGDAVAVLQNCNIFVRRPIAKQKNTITAQGRTDPNENTGIVIHNSVVAASSDLKPVEGSFKTFLGRPWQKYSRTVFMKTRLEGLVAPAGWLEWNGNFALDTLYYGEYMNTGAGAGTSGRVKWKGYHVITSSSDASKFTVENFLSGGSWLSAAGVPWTSGL